MVVPVAVSYGTSSYFVLPINPPETYLEPYSNEPPLLNEAPPPEITFEPVDMMFDPMLPDPVKPDPEKPDTEIPDPSTPPPTIPLLIYCPSPVMIEEV